MHGEKKAQFTHLNFYLVADTKTVLGENQQIRRRAESDNSFRLVFMGCVAARFIISGSGAWRECVTR